MRPIRFAELVITLALLTFSGTNVVAEQSVANLPTREPISLAARFLGITDPGTVQPSTAVVGDQRTFYVLNQATAAYVSVPATLKFASDHAYWWVQDGVSLDTSALDRSSVVLESKSLSALQALFGELKFPAGASDQRAHILNARTQGVGAYFSSVDAYTHAIHPYSNELPLIVVNVDSFKPGTGPYDETLAHEMQHMMHWVVSPASETWFDEGVSEVIASVVRGTPSRATSHGRRPDRSLIAWTDEPGAFSGQYDGSYLFAQYLADRYGLDALGSIARVGRPPSSIEAFLVARGLSDRFVDIFGDWTVANVKDAARENRPPQYRYTQADPDASIVGKLQVGQEWSDTVFQFGVDYLELDSRVTSLEVTPARTVKVVPADGADDDLVWWGNRADSLDSTLTRRIDLGGRSSVTLSFRTWFDMEPSFDHGYVAVSDDAGLRWRILESQATQSANSTGNAYGPSYTGQSGPSGQKASWVSQSVDLDAYAGRDVLVRFEYITDQGTTRQGWLVDDISLDGDISDAEQSEWQPDGFVRTPLSLPSRLLVQVVSGSGDGISVDRYWIDDGTPTTIPIKQVAGVRTIVTVSGVTPLTVEPMEYRVRALP